MISSVETATAFPAIPEDAMVLGLAGTPIGSFGAVFTARGLACLTFPADALEGCEAWIHSREPGHTCSATIRPSPPSRSS